MASAIIWTCNDLVLNSIKPGSHRVEIYRMERRGIFGGMKTKVLYSDNVFVALDPVGEPEC